MSFQRVQVFYNIETAALSNSVGRTLRPADFPRITEGQKNLVLKIDYIRTGGDLVTDLFLNSDTYNFNGAQDFDDATALLMQTTDSGFNFAGDRTDLDVTGGKHSLRWDADSAPLVTFLDGTPILPSSEIMGQIDVFPAAVTEPKSSFGFKYFVLNALTGTGPAAPLTNFYTKAETDALLAGKEDKQTTAATNKDGTVAAVHDVFTVPASRDSMPLKGFVKTVSITGSAVLPKIRWKTDGGIILHGPVLMSASEGLAGGIMRFSFGNDEALVAGTIVQAEITDAGTSTTHVLDFRYNGIEEDA